MKYVCYCGNVYNVACSKGGRKHKSEPCPLCGRTSAGRVPSALLNEVGGGMEVHPMCVPGFYDYQNPDGCGGKIPIHWSEGTLHGER